MQSWNHSEVSTEVDALRYAHLQAYIHIHRHSARNIDKPFMAQFLSKISTKLLTNNIFVKY